MLKRTQPLDDNIKDFFIINRHQLKLIGYKKINIVNYVINENLNDKNKEHSIILDNRLSFKPEVKFSVDFAP